MKWPAIVRAVVALTEYFENNTGELVNRVAQTSTQTQTAQGIVQWNQTEMATDRSALLPDEYRVHLPPQIYVVNGKAWERNDQHRTISARFGPEQVNIWMTMLLNCAQTALDVADPQGTATAAARRQHTQTRCVLGQAGT